MVVVQTSEEPDKKVRLSEIVGKGYNEVWNSKQRYVVVKGSRASKKSSTASLKIIVKMMKYPKSNTVVFRKTYDSLRDSCFAQLKWAIQRLGVSNYWEARSSPLELIYKPTGQKIMFRGLDNPLKITSITVETGVICFAWLEEAYELTDEAAFDKIDGSLRGEMPDGYYIQWLITFNPWDSGHWLKHRFFDVPDKDVLAITTNYKCNEWLTDQDREWFERIRRTDEERYKIEGLGDWGIAAGQFFKQWKSNVHVVEPFKIPKGWIRFRSMDWGSAHPYAVLWFAVDYDGNMYAYRELYGWGGKPNVGTGETAKEVGMKIVDLEDADEALSYAVLDNACWAKTGVTGPTIAEELNNELYEAGLQTFSKCSKGRVEGANALKQRLIGNEQADGTFKPAIYFFSNCIHSIRTIPMLAHDKRNPETYDTDGEDHACLIAGTMIETQNGGVPIEQIKVGDMVLTRQGFRQVVDAGLTKENAAVITVMLSDGRTLTGTGNHPVYVKGRGFIPLKDIVCGDIIYDKELPLFVNNVEGNLQHHIPNVTAQCSVQENVLQNTEETAELMTKHEFVLSAGKNLGVAGSVSKKLAAVNAVSVVWLSQEKEKHNVYNLTVDEVHEYFANGFLVHNCDAAVYGCLSRPWTPTPKKKSKARHDGYWEDESKTSMWAV